MSNSIVILEHPNYHKLAVRVCRHGKPAVSENEAMETLASRQRIGVDAFLFLNAQDLLWVNLDGVTWREDLLKQKTAHVVTGGPHRLRGQN